MRARTVATLTTGAVVVGAAIGARRRWRDLGATAEEVDRTYPGESSIPGPSSATTIALDVGAAPEEVWRWLVQIGQDRGGMYSYEWVENLFGLDIHNADEVHDEWQRLETGDRVLVVPPGRLGLPDGYAFGVTEVAPPHHLVLRQAPPEHPWNAVWTFTVEPRGPYGSRLVSRSRAQRLPGLAGAAASVGALVMEPVVVAMTRRMLVGIRDRAEQADAAGRGSAP